MGLWEQQHSMDCPEQKHNPPKYAIWAEKASLLYEAARANCFGSTHLFWVDIGSFRTGTQAANHLASLILGTFKDTGDLNEDYF
ncbi:g11288 [Coccomyxa elongata]